jgi:cell division septation protein DedD
MDKSYLEIKITFTHIVVMLVSVAFIGIMLFYLGYRAGRVAALKDVPAVQAAGDTVAKTAETVAVENVAVDEPPLKTDSGLATGNRTEQSISQELKLHQQGQPASTPDKPTTKPPAVEPKPGAIEPKPVASGTLFSIQVGAFAEYSAAQKEASHYAAMKYPIEIIAEVVNARKFFTVRVGNFANREQATREKDKLESLAHKTFIVKKSR